MAFELPILVDTAEAAEDLSSDQYRFVVLNSAGKARRPDSATESAYGILQNDPASGEEAQIMVLGISKLVANDALGVGAFVMPEYVSATDAGKADDATATLQYARGMVVGAAGAEDDLCSVLLIGIFPNISNTLLNTTTVTTDVTAGANTWSAAEMTGGLMLRDPTGAARSDVTATAAAIVGAITGATVGSSFEFAILNTADDASEIVTLTAGDSVTLTGVMTIVPGSAAHFAAVCTNVTAATEAVTIYRVDDMHHATTGRLIDVMTANTLTTAGAGTITAAHLMGGILLRDPAGASRTDTLPLATAIITALDGQDAIHNAFEFSIKNTADVATEIITVAQNTGVTLTGGATIVPGQTAKFLCVQTASTTVTVYRIGSVVHSAVGNLVDTKVVTTDATAGANTWTAAELLGGILLRDPAGADRSDISPAAADIITAMAGQAGTGNYFEFAIRNTADADETITLTAGVDVTLSGTVTIPWRTTRRFGCLITGAATVTIYDLGQPQHFFINVPLGQANTASTVTGCIAVTQTMQIHSISIASVTKPADADGTITLAVANYDKSATTSDNLLVAATFDLKSLTALTAEDLSLTATAADLIVENTDYVYATVAFQATPDTAPSGLCLTFDVELL